ncbi:hypothetical protein CCM_06431 [Cordyceps militaris CM01]|uniref:Uncharacterized protein n=1 Tax=Cordyceps militaris (strain CM01) TaxID=983644 RepID=G3JMC3_CORMM|nr:uncharacterized protein CCM_06431 [Cordyceps militaris CM01]EGX90011.1 hypothetical protein CCM_06431 [Cordyceps militaris CM01]
MVGTRNHPGRETFNNSISTLITSRANSLHTSASTSVVGIIITGGARGPFRVLQSQRSLPKFTGQRRKAVSDMNMKRKQAPILTARLVEVKGRRVSQRVWRSAVCTTPSIAKQLAIEEIADKHGQLNGVAAGAAFPQTTVVINYFVRRPGSPGLATKLLVVYLVALLVAPCNNLAGLAQQAAGLQPDHNGARSTRGTSIRVQLSQPGGQYRERRWWWARTLKSKWIAGDVTDRGREVVRVVEWEFTWLWKGTIRQ